MTNGLMESQLNNTDNEVENLRNESIAEETPEQDKSSLVLDTSSDVISETIPKNESESQEPVLDL
jgi:hypothetical protein